MSMVPFIADEVQAYRSNWTFIFMRIARLNPILWRLRKGWRVAFLLAVVASKAVGDAMTPERTVQPLEVTHQWPRRGCFQMLSATTAERTRAAYLDDALLKLQRQFPAAISECRGRGLRGMLDEAVDIEHLSKHCVMTICYACQRLRIRFGFYHH